MKKIQHEFKKNYKIILLYLFSFSLSLIFSTASIKYFDKNIIIEGKPKHMMISSDVAAYNYDAAKLIENLNRNQEIIFDREYFRSFLPQIIIAIYYKIVDEKITTNTSEEIHKSNDRKNITFNSKNGKLGFFIIQTLFYFFSIFLFYKTLSKYFSKKYLIIVFGILCLEPTINQYHSSFLTESIYISFTLILFSLVLKKNKSLITFILIGLLLGLMYAQRSISIGLFVPIVIFLIFSEKKNFIKYFFTVISCMLIVYSVIGFANYKRSGVFYLTSYQSKTGFFQYMGPYLLHKQENINKSEANTIIKNLKEKWIVENKLNLEIEADRLKFYQLQKNYSILLIKNNFLSFAKYHVWKTLQTMIIDPFMVFKSYYFDKGKKNEDGLRYWQYDGFYKKLFNLAIFYSLFVYLISFIGLLKIIQDFLKKKIKIEQLKIYILFIFIIIYFLSVSGWIGNPRYFAPCIAFLSFFPARGVLEINKFFRKK